MNERATREKDAVVVEDVLDAPPETVWRALTDKALVEAWLPADTRTERRVLEARPPELLRLSWRIPGEFDSEVRFVLRPLPEHRTLLRVVHDGFRRPLAANANTPPMALAA